jgi:hypothetical protein
VSWNIDVIWLILISRVNLPNPFSIQEDCTVLPKKELQENVTTELHAIENEIELIKLILRKSELQEPDKIEVRAAASCLHSVYNDCSMQ